MAPAVAAWTGSSLCNIHHVVGGEKWCGGLMEFFLSSVDLYNVSRKEIKRKNVELKDESKLLFIILGLHWPFVIIRHTNGKFAWEKKGRKAG